MEAERTLALIKPDAVRAGKSKEIKQLIELHGFTVIAEQKLQLTRARAEEFYAEHKGKPFFTRLVEFMSSGPVWAMVLAKPDAVKGWRALMGPTNVAAAREQAPRSMRALYGTDGTQNACHGSDSPASAEREIKFYFPNLVLEPLLDSEDCQQYISDRIQPALSKALTALARQKPTAEKFEAITFLAEYLLSNNPNKPKIVLPEQWDPSTDLLAGATAADDDDEDELFAQAEARAAAVRAAAEATATASPAPEASSAMQGSLSSSEQASTRIAHLHDTAAGTPLPSVDVPSLAQGDSTTAATGIQPSASLAGADEAATKVQAAFRGYQARKEMADMRRAGTSETEVHDATATLRQQLPDVAADMSAAGELAQSTPLPAAIPVSDVASNVADVAAVATHTVGSDRDAAAATQSSVDSVARSQGGSQAGSEQSSRTDARRSSASPAIAPAAAAAARPVADISEYTPEASAASLQRGSKTGSECSNRTGERRSSGSSSIAAAAAATAPPAAPQAVASEYTPEASSASGSEGGEPKAQPSEYTPAASEESSDEGRQGQSSGTQQQVYSPEQVAAVTRIQAAGRGMLDRKRVAGRKQAQGSGQADAVLDNEPEYSTDEDSG